MGIDLANESKSKVSLSNQSKDIGLTWDDATWTWDDADSPFDSPKVTLSKVSKSKISLSNESK